MARIVDAPPPRSRITEYPYLEWTCGEWMELRFGEDFYKDAHTVANAYNAYSRRQGFAGKAIARRDDHTPGRPFHLLYVWGDRERAASDGLPELVKAQVS